MTKANDYTALFQDLFSGKFADFNLTTNAFKNSSEFGAKLNKIALETAEKNTELANAWAKDAIKKYAPLTETQAEPANYTKVVTDVVTAQAQATPEHIAKFAEVAKSAQMATVELLMAAGKEFQADVTKNIKTATKAA